MCWFGCGEEGKKKKKELRDRFLCHFLFPAYAPDVRDEVVLQCAIGNDHRVHCCSTRILSRQMRHRVVCDSEAGQLRRWFSNIVIGATEHDRPATQVDECAVLHNDILCRVLNQQAESPSRVQVQPSNVSLCERLTTTAAAGSM
eukprot:COSAG02_NODE_484_length_21389_cov_9.202583_3_plen_144_part_00